MPRPKMTSNATERLTISLDAVDRAALDDLSKEMDRSLGWLVRQAVREYLERVRRDTARKGRNDGHVS